MFTCLGDEPVSGGTESVTSDKKDRRGKTVARLGETSWQHEWSLERNLLIGVQLSW